jgi:hypothetical protein
VANYVKASLSGEANMAQKLSNFMEPEGSLQCPYEFATGLYSETDESSLYSYPISLIFILISPSYLRLGIPSGIFASMWLKILIARNLPLKVSFTKFL